MPNLRPRHSHLAILAGVLLLGLSGPAAAGTIVDIATSSIALPVTNGAYELTGFIGSVELTLNAPAVSQQIYGPAVLTSTLPGTFDLPIRLDGIGLALPAVFDGSGIGPNGGLTVGIKGTTDAVSVRLRRGTRNSTAVTADFRLYDAATPEPGGLLLMAAGGAALAAWRRLRTRRR